VNRVVPDGDVPSEAEKIARKLASLGLRGPPEQSPGQSRFRACRFREALNYRNDPAVQEVGARHRPATNIFACSASRAGRHSGVP
jgi:hypothetical protein